MSRRTKHGLPSAPIFFHKDIAAFDQAVPVSSFVWWAIHPLNSGLLRHPYWAILPNEHHDALHFGRLTSRQKAARVIVFSVTLMAHVRPLFSHPPEELRHENN